MGTTAGIDPKVLDNCQQDAAFALNSWEQSGYNQPPEWDTSQDSSDAGLVDLGAFIGPFGNNPSLLGGSDGRQTLKKYDALVLGNYGDSQC